MMRRTILLLTTTALALIAAGGIALAATFTCTANPCDGTTEDDIITGTLNAETINGKAGNDEISARDANDTINGDVGNDTMHGELGDDQLNGGDGPDQLFGENGADRLNGGAGNDTLDGGPQTGSDSSSSDIYFFTPNWGNDTIVDGRGRGVIVPTSATAAAMPNLTVYLVSDPTGPEVSDGNGNTMNWENNDVKHATTGAGDDVISQRPRVSNGMNGGAGNDTYTGYTTDPPGEDSINDASGTADVLDLSNYNMPPKDSWRIWENFSTGNVETVQLWPGGAPNSCFEEQFCRDVFLNRYFDNTSTDVCASKPGPGAIETIKFADDPNVDFAQVRSLLGCPPLETTITSGPSGNVASTSASFGFSSNDGAATFECKLDGGTFGVCTSPKEYTGLIEGSTHTFEVRAVDAAGNTDPTPARRTWTVDTTPPRLNSTNPVNNATGIASTTVVDAFFSEQMDRSTVTTGTFTLTKQGSSTPVSARVEYLSNPKALLTPSSVLEANTTYTATVKGGPGGVKDLAGNPMAQDYSWTFTTAAPPTSCTKTGTANAETISGTSGDDFICAGGGNDTVKGLGGNDILKGEDGNDNLQGGVGNDTLDGGAGTDKPSYSASLTAVSASLTTNSSTGEGSDTFLNVENLQGSTKDDTLTGSAANNTLTGGAGNDTMKGEDGNDTLSGEIGDDSLDGGLGTDKPSYSGSLTAVIASLATNTSTGEGSDTFLGMENLQGSPKDDTLTGSTTNNTITGGAGNDNVVGSGGADTLKGEDGADAVDSKDNVNGNDSLDGGTGTDTKVTDTTEKSIVGFP